MTSPSTVPSTSRSDATKPVAVVTGASSGIGAASARALADAGYTVYIGARRIEKLRDVADNIDAVPLPLDVTDQKSVDEFCESIPRCDVLVNNAGGAHGTESIAEAKIEDWQWMYDTNVLGTLRVTRALLPKIEASGDGQVINISSIAGHEPYRGGGGYNAAKHAVAAMTRVLRLELLGTPVRVCEICPGLVNTEFSMVRFDGDKEKADAVYRGLEPMVADDIADAVTWIATRPSRMNVDQITIMARDQVSAQQVHRREG